MHGSASRLWYVVVKNATNAGTEGHIRCMVIYVKGRLVLWFVGREFSYKLISGKVQLLDELFDTGIVPTIVHMQDCKYIPTRY